jgi:hypothetical protein
MKEIRNNEWKKSSYGRPRHRWKGTISIGINIESEGIDTAKLA